MEQKNKKIILLSICGVLALSFLIGGFILFKTFSSKAQAENQMDSSENQMDSPENPKDEHKDKKKEDKKEDHKDGKKDEKKEDKKNDPKDEKKETGWVLKQPGIE